MGPPTIFRVSDSSYTPSLASSANHFHRSTAANSQASPFFLFFFVSSILLASLTSVLVEFPLFMTILALVPRGLDQESVTWGPQNKFVKYESIKVFKL